MQEVLSKGIKRRTLLKGLGVVSLMPLCPEVLALPIHRPPYKYNLDYSDFKSFRSSCAMECLHCNLTAYTYQDRLIKIESTKGFNVKGCMRGISRTKWVYHKDRLATPLLRTGAGIRSHYVQLMEKAVEPPGDAKPDYWIFARLAERFGFGEVFNQPVEHYIEAKLKGSGITLEQLRKGPVKPVSKPWIPFEGGQFRTSTGKAHFFIEGWQKKSYPPVVAYIPVKESPKGSPELAGKYPLMAVQRKQYPMNWKELEDRFGMPNHAVTQPNVVILAKSQ